MNRVEKICLVGCGTIGGVHARRLSGLVDLFFYSRSRSSAEKFNHAFGGGGIFDRLDQVLASSEITAVVLASPPEFHKEQIVQSLEAGKAVLVEKPMCVSQDEVDEVESALRGKPDGFLMVAENYYYKPSLAKIKALIQDDVIGDIESVAVKKLFTQAASGWKSRYGALLEGGIHFVALLSDFFACAPQSVCARFLHCQKGEAERHSVITLAYPDGSRATLEYSWNTRSLTKGILQHSHILGKKGSITFENNGIYVFLNAKGRSGLFFPGFKDMMGYHGMIQDFLRCLGDRSRRPYSDFSRAKRDLQIVFDAYKKLKVGCLLLVGGWTMCNLCL